MIQFRDDNIFYVCYSKHLKTNKQGAIIGKWLDGNYYNAKFLASSNNKRLLNDILKSLEGTNYPTVELNKLRGKYDAIILK